MERLCPVHGIPLEPSGKQWRCASCCVDYRVRGLCGECGAELERLAACGASNWWCGACNELKSKDAVKTELVPVERPDQG